MHKKIIAQKRLKEVLNYDPETGFFTWKKKIARCVKIGARTGSIQSNGYMLIGIDNMRYLAHRLAFIYMTGSAPDYVDHINHDEIDNRWENLASASTLDNARNQSRHSDNTSGANGVYWHKGKNKWHATYRMEGKNYHVWYFAAVAEAAKARKSADIKNGLHENHGG